MNKMFRSHLTAMTVAACSGLFLMTACEKENSNTHANIPEGALCINAESVHGSNGSKTTVNNLAVNWQSGDYVNLNGDEVMVNVDDGVAYLVGVNNTNDMYAAFPASIATIDGSDITLDMPSTYRYEKADGFQKVDLPMVTFATAGSEEMTFLHVNSTIQVRVANAHESSLFYIDSLTVASNSCALSGSVSVSFTGDSENPVSVTRPERDAGNNDYVQMLFNKNEVSVPANGSLDVQVPVLYTTSGVNISVKIVGHYAYGADFESGRIDDAAKIVYNNSTTATLKRAGVFTAPCTIRTTGSAAVSKIYPKFTVSAGGDKVYFSRGNLQYVTNASGNAGDPYHSWRFAATQLTTLGTPNTHNALTYRDLFAWGDTPADVPPVMPTSENPAPSNSSYSWSEWGNKPILRKRGTWRTLTKDEWEYLLNTRSTGATVNEESNARYAKANVNGKKGVIVFPDGFESPELTGTTWGAINNTIDEYTSTVSSGDWALLEAAGCVFLPATGVFKYGNDTQIIVRDPTEWCNYWSSTASGDEQAYVASSRKTNVLMDSENRRWGNAVRLVQDAN